MIWLPSFQAAAESARKQADDANDDFYKLNTEFKAVSNDLNNTSATIGSAKVQALDLQERAQKLANDFANKLNLLVGKNYIVVHCLPNVNTYSLVI